MARAPSNIAFIKYWGKSELSSQWPANDSISMTLDHLATVTCATPDPTLADHTLQLNQVDHKRGDKIASKVFQHLDRLSAAMASETKFHIRSANSFPSACGIASSASGMAALTIASTAAMLAEGDLEKLRQRKFGSFTLNDLARLGSGSATRSLLGGFVQWQKGPSATEQTVSQLFSAEYWPLADMVVVLDQNEKKISSSEGHQQAWQSPLFLPRLAALPERAELVQFALKNRDFSLLGQQLEAEALEMHAVMMTSEPPITYWVEETSQFLTWLRKERVLNGLPAYFTIDAGPNIHVICEQKDRAQVQEKLKNHWQNYRILVDTVGSGPKLKVLGFVPDDPLAPDLW